MQVSQLHSDSELSCQLPPHRYRPGQSCCTKFTAWPRPGRGCRQRAAGRPGGDSEISAANLFTKKFLKIPTPSQLSHKHRQSSILFIPNESSYSARAHCNSKRCAIAMTTSIRNRSRTLSRNWGCENRIFSHIPSTKVGDHTEPELIHRAKCTPTSNQDLTNSKYLPSVKKIPAQHLPFFEME